MRKLASLEDLAVLPTSGENCAQWSSHDRSSHYDEATGKYVKWDSNGDADGIVRKEGDALVFGEMQGPGCIWRMWSATPGTGHVRIYLDGSEIPAVDLPFSGYFDGKNPPFIYPALVHNAASGWNNYVPIPFAKSCKITADKDWGSYYHFTYSTYPKGTRLPTFRRDLSPEETEALAQVDQLLLSGLGSDPAGKRRRESAVQGQVVVPAGGAVQVAALRGRQAITAVRMKLDASGLGDVQAALREVVMRIRWDGEHLPSVWVPLGDFFGTAPGINKYRSLPVGATDEGFYSFWYMPFSRSAAIELANDGEQTVPVEFSITHAPLSRSARHFGRFHAKWHRDAFLPAEPERSIDWTILKTWGRGRFCGAMLHIWNPNGGWWGEGDEKFFVDGEKFPSTFGTGSEDYFGYAWCNPALFQNAYHNQTRNDGSNVGHVSVNRWHIADNVPFRKSFEGAIEKYFPNSGPTLYACTAYWYLAPGGRDDYEPAIPVKERTSYYTPRRVYSEPDAIEGEAMSVLEVTGGAAGPQPTASWGIGWSGDTQLWWKGGAPGSQLTLALPVETAGKYTLAAQFTKAPDYGIVQLYLNGARLGAPIDLFNGGVAPSGRVCLGAVELSSGQHRLTIEIVGANESAVKSYMAGLDYVKLELTAFGGAAAEVEPPG